MVWRWPPCYAGDDGGAVGSNQVTNNQIFIFGNKPTKGFVRATELSLTQPQSGACVRERRLKSSTEMNFDLFCFFIVFIAIESIDFNGCRFCVVEIFCSHSECLVVCWVIVGAAAASMPFEHAYIFRVKCVNFLLFCRLPSIFGPEDSEGNLFSLHTSSKTEKNK